MANRLSKLRAAMVKRRLDAILVSSVPNITYLTNFSHFSKIEREAFLFITRNKQYILTDGRYAEAVKNNIKDYKLVETSSKRTFEKALKDLAKKHKVKRVGFDHRNITVAEHKKFSSVFKIIKHFDIDNFRAIKSNQEILAIDKACKLGDKTFKYILNKIKPGVTEKQLAFEIEFFIKKHGAEIAFPPIVAFGANSSIPHHRSTHNSKLQTYNSIILLDFGAKIDNYCSDMTRTVFFGKPNVEQKKMYRTVLDAQKRAIEYLKNSYPSSGVRSTKSRSSRLSRFNRDRSNNKILVSQIDKVAINYILKRGFPTIPHSLGHGIGIEVHEAPKLSPKSKDILKPGMVFTIEPGSYLPGFGGVRIEDVVVLEETGARILTKSPKHIITL